MRLNANFRVHCAGDRFLGATRNLIYESFDRGESWQLVGRLPISRKEGIRSFFRLGQRLFRDGVYHIFPIGKSGVVVFGYRRIYHFDDSLNRFNCVDRIVGSRPLCVCQTPENQLFYGEYTSNPDRRAVLILGSFDKGRRWESVYSFSDVRHIHGVFYDRYTDTIWATTGDTDEESIIWQFDRRFNKPRKVLKGSQQTRAVQLLFSKDSVFFGSDSPLERNFLYRLSRSSGKVTPVQEVGGSIFYGCKVKDGLVFSTAVEPSDINTRQSSEVWYSETGDDWTLISSYPKDIWPVRFFQYGQVLFPSGENNTSELWYTPFSTEMDGRSLHRKLP